MKTKYKPIIETQPDLKLVYSAKKKVVIREMGCKRAESKFDSRFF